MLLRFALLLIVVAPLVMLAVDIAFSSRRKATKEKAPARPERQAPARSQPRAIAPGDGMVYRGPVRR